MKPPIARDGCSQDACNGGRHSRQIHGPVGPFDSECSALLGGNHERPAAKIILGRGWAATVHPATVRLTRLDTLPSLPSPPVEEDLYTFVPGETACQCVTKIGLVARHDDSASHFLPTQRWLCRRASNRHVGPLSCGAIVRKRDLETVPLELGESALASTPYAIPV